MLRIVHQRKRTDFYAHLRDGSQHEMNVVGQNAHPVYCEASFLCDPQPVRAQFASDSRVENSAPKAGREGQMMVEIKGGVRSFQ